MSTEVSSRISADSSLDVKTSTAMSSEISSRLSADESVDVKTSTAMSTEVSSRISAETSLDGKTSTAMSSEVSSRISAGTSLTTRLSTEELTRDDETNTISNRFSITPVVLGFYVGNGLTSSHTVSHNLNTKDVIVQVFEVATGETVETGSVRLSNADDVVIDFNSIPSENQYRVVIMGIQYFEFTYSNI